MIFLKLVHKISYVLHIFGSQ